MNPTAIIIEDEELARLTIINYLKRYFPEIKVIAEIENTVDAINYLNANRPDVIFMDIQLADNLAFKILEQFEDVNFRIIFTTAYDNHTLEAFKNNAFGYLIKPIDPDDFQKIVARVVNDIQSENNSITSQIKVKVPNGSLWISAESIVNCESLSNYTTLYCSNGKSYVLAKTLKKMEHELKELVRVHQSHLINPNYLKSKTIAKNHVELINGRKIPVSRNQKDNLITLFSKMQ